MLSCGEIFLSKNTSFIIKTKKQFGSKEGDLITLLNIFKIFGKLKRDLRKRFCYDYSLNLKALTNIEAFHKKLSNLMTFFGYKIKSSDDDVENIMRCFVKGFFLNIAKRNPEGTYSPLKISSSPSEDIPVLNLESGSILSVYFPTYVMFIEIYKTSQGKIFMKNASEIFPEWLLELVPDYFANKSKELVEKKLKEECQRQEKFQGLIEQKIKNNTQGNSSTSLNDEPLYLNLSCYIYILLN